MGFRLAIFPGALTRLIIPVITSFLATLKQEGSTATWRERMLDFARLNSHLGTSRWLDQAAVYDVEAVGRSRRGDQPAAE